ncbi:MAG: PstS family phosphate ABC transporter substrate-binding protein [Oligoflexales bacterium]
MLYKKWSITTLIVVLLFGLGGNTFAESNFKGRVRIDGSSTVYPITEAVAEEFGIKYPQVRVTVGVSGTGGGFKKFLNQETDINDASRLIKIIEENRAEKLGIRYVQIPVAYDGISVVINKRNAWLDHLTVDELHQIWKPGSTIKTWKQLRPNWPDIPIKLYGPGTHSGTFDYFTEVINGKSQASRSDFTKSEDDNMLVRGVAGNQGALGYFGLSYYVENKNKIKAAPIKNKGSKAILPSFESVFNGSYKPLARQVYIYINSASLKRPAVSKFVEFYLENAGSLVKDVGYVPLQKEEYEASWKLIQKISLSA